MAQHYYISRSYDQITLPARRRIEEMEHEAARRRLARLALARAKATRSRCPGPIQRLIGAIPALRWPVHMAGEQVVDRTPD